MLATVLQAIAWSQASTAPAPVTLAQGHTSYWPATLGLAELWGLSQLRPALL